MPKKIAIITLAIIAMGITTAFIFQRQEGEEMKKTFSVVCSPTTKSRVLSIILDWPPPTGSFYDPNLPINITRRINALEPKPELFACLIDLLQHEDPIVRIFVSWSLYEINDEVNREAYINPELLAIGLEDEEPTVRILTAATLLGIGDTSGLKVLRELQLLDVPMIFSHPPQLVSQYAKEILDGYKKYRLLRWMKWIGIGIEGL